MLEKADQRGKVAILLMCSSGMRVGALSTLKVRNLQKIDKYNLYRIMVYEGDDEEYVTFCTPECAAVIDSYLEYRERNGERPIKEDAPLIREEFDINDEIKAARPKSLGQQAFRRMIRRIGYDSGVMEKRAAVESKRGQRRLVKETHGFRKFFQTTAITSGMNPLFSELLMGHTSGGLALESYVRPSENDLLEGNDKMIGYVGIIDALTINEENRLRREVQTLKIDKSKMEQVLERINLLENKILNQQ
jgi:integrase